MKAFVRKPIAWSILVLILLSGCGEDPAPLPEAGFSFAGDNNFAPLKIAFVNDSKNAISYEWDFGDGEKSTEQSPEHLYKTGNNYTVSLKATNSDGASDIATKTVVVLNVPTKLQLNRLLVTDMPFGGWDSDGSGPDVYFRISDDYDNEYFVTSPIENVSLTDLPLTFDISAQVNSLDYNFRLEIWDNDLIVPEFIGGYFFKARNDMPTDGSPYPEIITFDSPSSQVRLDLIVKWLE
jgi:PKD repeat protein